MKKNDYVLVKNTVLNPSERAPQVPDDTKQVPLVMWVKGFLLEDSEIGKIATVKTMTGRTVEGEVVAHNPRYEHDFGDFVEELLYVGNQIRDIISEVK